MRAGGEVANAQVCKTCIRGFDPRPALQLLKGTRAFGPPLSFACPGRQILAQSPFQWTYASSASKIFRLSGMTLVFKTTFEVFTRVSPDHSLERLTECSVRLVTDRPGNVDELFVALFE
jgi:hypothetical protein